MIIVEKISKADWEKYGGKAHMLCFGNKNPSAWDRIDFALLATKNGVPLGYMTCREPAADLLYCQFGGAFPGTRSSFAVWPAYQAFLEYCLGKYKQVGSLIENDNFPMLKLAMKAGYKIIGVRNFQGSILLDHLLEFEAP